jgi:hypothetical protein
MMKDLSYILADILELIGIATFVCFVFFVAIAIGG